MKKNTIHKKASHFQKVKTRQELANEYGITTRTLNNRLKKANLYIPDGIIFPKYLRKIYNTFGIPSRKADSIAKSDSASDSALSGKDQPITST
ncbi:MAG: hypothetical protein GX999_09645 [Bacteroidales bacterium]|jgi:transcriptional antiterminator|nr:hypothetical protein [Bacteroidales bacterium]